MPFLEVTESDGSKWTMAQGHAIVRHVARRFGFDGANEYERCKCAHMCVCVCVCAHRNGSAIGLANGTLE